MKLNATIEMIPVTWPEFANLHPFVPQDQALGYKEMIDDLNTKLCQVTGYDAISQQPNSGAQGNMRASSPFATIRQHGGVKGIATFV